MRGHVARICSSAVYDRWGGCFLDSSVLNVRIKDRPQTSTYSEWSSKQLLYHYTSLYHANVNFGGSAGTNNTLSKSLSNRCEWNNILLIVQPDKMSYGIPFVFATFLLYHLTGLYTYICTYIHTGVIYTGRVFFILRQQNIFTTLHKIKKQT